MKRLLPVLLLLCVLLLVFVSTAKAEKDDYESQAVPLAFSDKIDDYGEQSNQPGDSHDQHYEIPTGYAVAKFHWYHVATPYTVAIWILLASFAKTASQDSVNIFCTVTSFSLIDGRSGLPYLDRYNPVVTWEENLAEKGRPVDLPYKCLNGEIFVYQSIGLHLSKKFSDIFSDSALLIMVGLMVGIILSLLNIESTNYSLNSHSFFLYLMPPIVFDAGYFMPNRAFFDNIGSILVFAVIGTIWNMATIGLALWAIGLTGIFSAATPLLHVLLFTSLISAVDPVAVSVVFEEIHVNEVLFITVFGESLLNDAVTVVLYQIFLSFSEIGAENLIPIDFMAGGISFFVVGLGGVIIGLIWAFIVSFTTKYTKHVKVLNPVFVYLMPYCAYLTAEMFGLSAITAIVFCGIAMKRFVKLNISSKAAVSIKYFTKMLSGISQTVIFMFLGLSTIRKHHWDITFIALTVIFCLVFRAIGIVIQSYLLNKWRLNKLSNVDQFIMAYGGLRGVIAFGLATSIPDSIPAKDMFITATIVVIYFTVFLQGTTMKPLVNYLKVKKEEIREKKMTEHILERQLDYIVAGVEDICGNRGHNWLRNSFESFITKHLTPLLVRESRLKPHSSKIMREYTKLTMKEAIKVARGRMPTSSNSNNIFRSQSVVQETASTNVHNAYTNPSFGPNCGDAAVTEGVKADAEAKIKNKHFDIHKILPKKHRLYSGSNADIDSSDVKLNERAVEKLNRIGLKNVLHKYHRKSQEQFNKSDSVQKEVFFTLASENMDGDVHQLSSVKLPTDANSSTAAETSPTAASSGASATRHSKNPGDKISEIKIDINLSQP